MSQTGKEVNRCEFRLVGMSRSGNHAIINWIMRQARGRVCFLNCAEPRTNPFATARPMGDGQSRVSNFPLDLQSELAGRHSYKDYLLYSYEDCYVSMVADDGFEARHDDWVGRSLTRRDVLVLRDPFNLFASRSKSGMYRSRLREDEPNLVTRSLASRIWKQHAREYLQPGRHLLHRPLAINYNLWVSDSNYRHEIAENLGLQFSDTGIDMVPPTAGGSSFDGVEFDGAGRRMSVLNRWSHFDDDPSFWLGFDRQMIDLSEKIFGSAPQPVER